MARIDVWYFCRECKRRRKAGEGLLFCPDCGGEVERIGWRSRPNKPTPNEAPAVSRWRKRAR